jgi:hypothetical protein
MSPVEWYRSSRPAPHVARSGRRAVRDRLLSWLPAPAVRGKTMVLHSRQTFPRPSWRGLRSEFHGVFSEFHSVLGACAYAEAGGAEAVRVDFRSPLYVEPGRGPNWWTYVFREAVVPVCGVRPSGDEVHLDRTVTRYGRYGGFADLVQGATPYFYPMTYGLCRQELHRLAAAYAAVRDDVLDEAASFAAERFEPGAYVVGVHYRGTDATRPRVSGWLTHYRSERVAYRAYADEARRAIEAASPRRHQVFVATDEIECLEFMQREFGDRLVSFDGSPRVRAEGRAVHLDRTLPVSGYQKAKSALVDSLLLARTSYLVKGRSNLSDASLVFNPALAYSFRPDIPLPHAVM